VTRSLITHCLLPLILTHRECQGAGRAYIQLVHYCDLVSHAPGHLDLLFFFFTIAVNPSPQLSRLDLSLADRCIAMDRLGVFLPGTYAASCLCCAFVHSLFQISFCPGRLQLIKYTLLSSHRIAYYWVATAKNQTRRWNVVSDHACIVVELFSSRFVYALHRKLFH